MKRNPCVCFALLWFLGPFKKKKGILKFICFLDGCGTEIGHQDEKIFKKVLNITAESQLLKIFTILHIVSFSQCWSTRARPFLCNIIHLFHG